MRRICGKFELLNYCLLISFGLTMTDCLMLLPRSDLNLIASGSAVSISSLSISDFREYLFHFFRDEKNGAVYIKRKNKL